MFQPPVFREDDIEVMHAMIRENPFASLLSLQNGEMVCDHIPMMIHAEESDQGTLRGHIARANPMRRLVDHDARALVVFTGLHAYVTPSWYPSKDMHDKVVPTWNYISVHARGKIDLIHDEAWILSHLNALTDLHEEGREKPWTVSDAPSEFIHRQLRGITGIEIKIESLQGTWKVSQNKDTADNAGVAEGLRCEHAQAARDMAAIVETRRR